MVAMAQSEAETGDSVPTRKKKAVPQHVQDILQQDSMAESVLEQLPTLQDFEPVRKVSREDPASKAPPKIIKTELYVRGIPYEMDNDGLKELFKVHKPRSTRVMKDKQGRKALGFGFVTFYNEFKAAEAMTAMNGFAVRNERGVETQLSISFATEKKVKVKNRDLSTVRITPQPRTHTQKMPQRSRQQFDSPFFILQRSGQQKIQDTIAQRKAEIIARDSHKVVMDLRDMPRSFQRLADRNPDMIKELQESVRKGAQDAGRMDDDDVMDMEDAEARALRLVEDFKESGNRIEDVTDRQLRQERDAEEDDEVDKMLYGEIGENDEDWVFVPDGAGGGVDVKDEDDVDDEEDDYPEETEEERAAWIEYKKKQDAKRDSK